MNVPATKDLIQECEGNLEIPEIRVWCHPHVIGEEGDDYFYKFDSFDDAMKYIKEHPEAERIPLIAFRGYELNLFDMALEPSKIVLKHNFRF